MAPKKKVRRPDCCRSRPVRPTLPAGWSCARSARCQHHASSAKATTRPPSPSARQGPSGDHRLRGPVVLVHHKTPPAAKLVLKAAGVDKGRRKSR